MLSKFESNRMVQNSKKFWVYWQKTGFFKTNFDTALTPFCKTFFKAEELLDGKLLIFRLLYFIVPKIMVVRQVYTGQKLQQTWPIRPVWKTQSAALRKRRRPKFWVRKKKEEEEDDGGGGRRNRRRRRKKTTMANNLGLVMMYIISLYFGH